MMIGGNKLEDLYAMSTEAIIGGLCMFLKNERLNRDMTQTELAEKAGLNRTTISKIENGYVEISLHSFVQILRALELLELLNTFRQQPAISPLQMMKMELKKSKRASKRE